MAIDPRIPAMGNPIAIPPPAPVQSTDPLRTLQTRGAIEDVRAQVEQRRAAAEAARQKAADEAAVRQIFGKYGNDIPGALTELYKVAPGPAAAFEQKWREANKEQALGAKAELETKGLQISTALKLLQARTPQNYPVLRSAIVGVSKDADTWLPKEYDEDALNAVEQMGLTAEQRNAAHQKVVDAYLKGDYHGAASRAYGALDPAAPDLQAQWDQTTASLRPMMPAGVLDQFGTVGSPAAVAHAQQLGISPEKRAELTKPVAVTTTDEAGNEATTFVTPTPGATYAKPTQHSAIYKEWQDYKAQGGTLDFNAYQTMDANRKATRVTMGQGSESDVKDYVQGMMDGRLPPVMPGRASPMYASIMAEAQRRGFNLAQAVTDWTATQKHTATLNGSQQLRLNQSINALPEMLDKVDTLAQQWKGGRFPILNRANLAAAKNGVYGADVAKVATQLDSQIADVVADLGNVYMGGNSPTDHALGLAAKSLQADWSEPVLRQMITLAKDNVKIRRNSINSTGVAGASADNPYAAPAPAAPPPGTTSVNVNPFRK